VLKSLKYDIKELLLPVIIMVLVLTAPWIITNSIHNSALKRAVSMAESPGWSNHQRAILLDEISHYYSSIGNLEAAIRFSEKSYQYQKNERVLYSLGLMYFNNADYNRAFESFALLKPSNYKQKYVLMMLGDISFKLENFQSAIDSYKQYLQIDSLNHGIYFNTGMAYYQMNKLDSALIYFKASSFLNQTHIQSLNMTAQIYSDIGFLDSAITYYEELVSIDPANPEFYFNLALCYSDMKLFDKALENAITAKSKGISSQYIDGLITELNKYIGGQLR
jgi:tetratricopeptide (TPR) repeat protein